MKISDLLRLSTDNLRRRKGRTALTVIGVVVGTFSIIVMISLGIASNAQNEAMLQSWGDLTQITINNYQWGAASGDVPVLDDKMLDDRNLTANYFYARVLITFEYLMDLVLEKDEHPNGKEGQ